MRSTQDFLASDYDTLCRVDVETMKLAKAARLQGAGPRNLRQFIGQYEVLGDGTCVVARPFSSVVLVLNSYDFKSLARAPVSGQPLHVCMVSENRALTRDWKTGQPALEDFAAIS